MLQAQLGNLIKMSVLMAVLCVFVWELTGFSTSVRKARLSTGMIRMSILLCAWILLKAADIVAPTDTFHWLFTGFTFGILCLSCHEWCQISYRISLHATPTQTMQVTSLLLMLLFTVMVALNPWHGLVFTASTLAHTRPGPLYFLFCGVILILYGVGCVFIMRHLLQHVRSKPGLLLFLVIQPGALLLFLALFVKDLLMQSVSLSVAFPSTYILSNIVLMRFLMRVEDAHRFGFPSPDWKPEVLQLLDEAVLTFNTHGRVLSWNGVMPELADGISSYAEWMEKLENEDVAEKDRKIAEAAWAGSLEINAGSFTLVHQKRRISWQLIPIRKAHAHSLDRVLLLSDTTAAALMEEETLSLQRACVALGQSIASYGDLEWRLSMEREIAMSMEMLRSGLKTGVARIDEDLETASLGDSDPASGSIRFQDAFLHVRKTLLTLRKGLHDLIMLDPNGHHE